MDCGPPDSSSRAQDLFVCWIDVLFSLDVENVSPSSNSTRLNINLQPKENIAPPMDQQFNYEDPGSTFELFHFPLQNVPYLKLNNWILLEKKEKLLLKR